MRKLIGAALVAAVTFVAQAQPAFAQTTGAKPQPKPATQKPAKPAKPPRPKVPVGFRGFFNFDVALMAASDTFSAQTGSSVFLGFGGGAEVLNVWQHLFVRGAFGQESASGTRIIPLDNGDIIDTLNPITVRVRSFEMGAGWRVLPPNRPKLVVSVGGGVLLTMFSDQSPILLPDENDSGNIWGMYAHAGVEFELSKSLIAGIEGQYRLVPDGLVGSGVARAFNETNLGGIVIRGIFGFRFRK